MRMHVIRHVDFEGPAAIAEWAAERGHDVSETLALTEQYPPVSDIDMLVVMGGPMAADDEAGHPWLHAEKHYVAEAIEADRLVFGVCLGAQILAEVCGGSIGPNPIREIGWYPVTLSEMGRLDPVFSVFEDGLVVGHWHGDTFSVPGSAQLTMSSDACANQAFSLMDGRIVGVQFHLEWGEDSVFDLVEHCAAELDGGPRTMDAAQLLEGSKVHGPRCRTVLWSLLDKMVATRAKAEVA